MKLHLGVIEVPEPEGGTSYTVGKDLEERYGVFSMFYNTYEKFIAKELEEDAGRALTNMLNSNPISDPFGNATEEIDNKFHYFITSKEIEQVAGQYGEQGIPTQAALEGLTLRTAGGKTVGKVRKGQKFKKVQGARRPSFIYSGVFEASLKTWVST